MHKMFLRCIKQVAIIRDEVEGYNSADIVVPFAKRYIEQQLQQSKQFTVLRASNAQHTVHFNSIPQTTSTVSRDTNNVYSCNCSASFQFKLPCCHIIAVHTYEKNKKKNEEHCTWQEFLRKNCATFYQVENVKKTIQDVDVNMSDQFQEVREIMMDKTQPILPPPKPKNFSARRKRSKGEVRRQGRQLRRRLTLNDDNNNCNTTNTTNNNNTTNTTNNNNNNTIISNIATTTTTASADNNFAADGDGYDSGAAAADDVTGAAAYDEDPAFLPLSEDQQVLVKRAWGKGNCNDVLSKIGLQRIKRSDLRRLQEGNWLNDEVINAYMILLQERNVRDMKNDEIGRMHFFNTYFYEKLAGRENDDYKFANVQAMTQKMEYSLFECEKIIIPICQNHHWILAVINIKKRCIFVLDSMNLSNDSYITKLLRYIVDEFNDKAKYRVMTTNLNQNHFTLQGILNVPQQQNNSDCGVFTCKFADFESRNRELSFDQSHMIYFRQRICAEIMNSYSK